MTVGATVVELLPRLKIKCRYYSRGYLCSFGAIAAIAAAIAPSEVAPEPGLFGLIAWYGPGFFQPGSCVYIMLYKR